MAKGKSLIDSMLALQEMGGPCSTYGGGERCVQGFGGKT
jgi:hypothetical protein